MENFESVKGEDMYVLYGTLHLDFLFNLNNFILQLLAKHLGMKTLFL